MCVSPYYVFRSIDLITSPQFFPCLPSNFLLALSYTLHSPTLNLNSLWKVHHWWATPLEPLFATSALLTVSQMGCQQCEWGLWGTPFLPLCWPPSNAAPQNSQFMSHPELANNFCLFPIFFKVLTFNQCPVTMMSITHVVPSHLPLCYNLTPLAPIQPPSFSPP